MADFNDSSKILSKISPEMPHFAQSGPKNFVFLRIACSKFAPKSIHQIAWFQFQKYKNFQLLRGYIPPQTPPMRTSVQLALTRHQIIHPPMSKTDLCPCLQPNWVLKALLWQPQHTQVIKPRVAKQACTHKVRPETMDRKYGRIPIFICKWVWYTNCMHVKFKISWFSGQKGKLSFLFFRPYWQNIKFLQNCPKFHILTKIVIFKV